MKKVLLFIFVFLIVFPMSINAQVLRDYNESVAYSRDYINKFPFWTRYLVYNSSDLLSKEEFDVTYNCTTATLGQSGCSCKESKGTYSSQSYNCTTSTCNNSGCSCKTNYSFDSETSSTNQTSCSTSPFTCNKDNVNKTKTTSCTPTAWSCASGHAKASGSWCYK